MTTSISLRMCVLSLCHLCCSPDDLSLIHIYPGDQICLCSADFLLYREENAALVLAVVLLRIGCIAVACIIRALDVYKRQVYILQDTISLHYFCYSNFL